MNIDSLKTPTEFINYLRGFLKARQKAYEHYNRLSELRASKIQRLRYIADQMEWMDRNRIIAELKRYKDDILSLCNPESSVYQSWVQFFDSKQ